MSKGSATKTSRNWFELPCNDLAASKSFRKVGREGTRGVPCVPNISVAVPKCQLTTVVRAREGSASCRRSAQRPYHSSKEGSDVVWRVSTSIAQAAVASSLVESKAGTHSVLFLLTQTRMRYRTYHKRFPLAASKSSLTRVFVNTYPFGSTV